MLLLRDRRWDIVFWCSCSNALCEALVESYWIALRWSKARQVKLGRPSNSFILHKGVVWSNWECFSYLSTPTNRAAKPQTVLHMSRQYDVWCIASFFNTSNLWSCSGSVMSISWPGKEEEVDKIDRRPMGRPLWSEWFSELIIASYISESNSRYNQAEPYWL